MSTITLHKTSIQPEGTPGSQRLYMEDVSTDPQYKAWRIYTTAVTTQNYVELAELRFMPELPATGTPFASSIWSGDAAYNQTKPFDEDQATSWASAAGGLPAFVGKIYAAAVGITSVKITAKDDEGTGAQQGSAPENFIIQGSNDTTDGTDGAWVDVKVVTGETGWGDSELRSFEIVAASQTPHIGWRVRATENYGANHAGLAEITFTPNTQNEGTTYASSQHGSGNFNASNAFDNNLTTAWNTDNTANGLPAWIAKIYPAAVPVSDVTMVSIANNTTYGNAFKTFDIQYSDDTTTGVDGTWTTIVSKSNETAWGDNESRTYELPGAVSTDGAHVGWRLFIATNYGGTNYISIAKLKFSILDSFEAGTTRFASTALVHSDWSVDKGLDDIINDGSNRGWESDGIAVDQYIGVVWLTAKNVDTMEITARTLGNLDQTPKNFRLQYSDDTTNGTDGTWADALSVTDAPAWTLGEVRSYTIPTTVVDQSLGLHMTTENGDTVISIPDKGNLGNSTASSSDHLVTVADIAARDVLVLGINKHVRVTDASADPNVDAGEATYFYDPLTLTFQQVGGSDQGICIHEEAW